MRAVGEGTMESMKTVERPWVITIALTGPNRRDRDALTIPASPIVRFETARRGPLYASGTPYLRKSQVGTRGMMKPAPRPMRLLTPENFTSGLRARSFVRAALGRSTSGRSRRGIQAAAPRTPAPGGGPPRG